MINLADYINRASFSKGQIIDESDLRNRVKVVNYDDIASNIETLYNTGSGFVKDEVIYWAYTSGTSSKPKKIPITEFSYSVYKDALSPLFIKLSNKYANEIFEKDSFLPLVGKYQFDVSPAGITVGSISGFTVFQSYEKFKPFMVYDFLESDVMNLEQRWKFIQEASRKKGIKWIMATNPAYIYEILRNNIGNDEFTPFEANKIWPNLKIIITMTGGNNKPYIEKLQLLFPDIEIWDPGIGASEGYYMKTDFKPDPIGTLNDNHYFFEFLELGLKYNDSKTLLKDDLIDGIQYQLIVTTPNGFLRYNTQDVFIKENSIFRYIGRSDKTYSFVGERLTEIQINDCLDLISLEFGNNFRLFKLIFINQSYKFLFYCKNKSNYMHTNSLIADKIDKILNQFNINYYYARNMYKVLDKPIIEFKPIETYYSSNLIKISNRLLRQEKNSILIQ